MILQKDLKIYEHYEIIEFVLVIMKLSRSLDSPQLLVLQLLLLVLRLILLLRPLFPR